MGIGDLMKLLCEQVNDNETYWRITSVFTILRMMGENSCLSGEELSKKKNEVKAVDKIIRAIDKRREEANDCEKDITYKLFMGILKEKGLRSTYVSIVK